MKDEERLNPKTIEKENLIRTYGVEIDEYLKNLEKKHQIKPEFLKRHSIEPVYRAKMIDWMAEVMGAFKLSDQTFFMAVNLMDRYFNNCQRSIKLDELHLIGITSMFTASKYEDVRPLIMRVVVKKIAHDKYSSDQIMEKELDMLRSIGFRVSAPTVMDFLEKYIDAIGPKCKNQKFVQKMGIYLAKQASFQYPLAHMLPSEMAAACTYVAIKIYEQMTKESVLNKGVVQDICDQSSMTHENLIPAAKSVLSVAQTFEQLFPGFNNLKNTHVPELNKIIEESQAK